MDADFEQFQMALSQLVQQVFSQRAGAAGERSWKASARSRNRRRRGTTQWRRNVDRIDTHGERLSLGSMGWSSCSGKADDERMHCGFRGENAHPSGRRGWFSALIGSEIFLRGATSGSYCPC